MLNLKLPRLVPAALTAGFILFASPSLNAAVITWTNLSGGDWNTAINWDANQVPGTNDTAVITNNGVTVSLSVATIVSGITLGNSANCGTGGPTLAMNNQTLELAGPFVINSCGQFLFNSGTLVGHANSSISGNFAWTGGRLAGTVTLAVGSTLQISAGADHDWPDCVFTNNGTVAWTGGRIRGGSGSPGTVIYNKGLWDCQGGDLALNADFGFNGVFFNNQGTLRKSSPQTGTGSLFSSGVQLIQLAGTVEILNGTLVLQGGGTFSGGTIPDSGGILSLNGGAFNINGTVTGTNVIENGGNLVGTVVVQGALEWQYGSWNNTPSVTINPGSTVSITTGADHDLANCLLNNNGSVRWIAGRIRGGSFAPGTIINNGGLWDIQNDNYAFNADYGFNGVVINNTGTIRKSVGTSPASTVLSGGVLFNQFAGAVDVRSGQLVLQGGGNFLGGIATNNNGILYLSSGNFNLNGTLTGTNFIENSGNLTGTNVIQGALQWQGGVWNSAASVTVTTNSIVFANGGNDHDFVNTVVTNLGTVIWTQGRFRGGGNTLNPGTAIYNYGLWDVQNDDIAMNADGGFNGVVFNNFGAFRKSVGNTSHSTVITGGVFFNQLAGNVDVRNGQLVLQGGANFLGGTATNNNGILYFSIGGFNLNGTITGSNVIENSGSLVGTNVIRGALQWQAGTWNNAASVTIPSNSTVFVNTGNDHDFANTVVTNLGTVAWAQGRIRGGGGSLNPGTAVYNYGLWDVQNDGYPMNNDAGGNGTVFNNLGAFRKSVGTNSNSTVIVGGVLFNQLAGNIDVQQGNFVLQGGANFTGGFVTTNASTAVVLSIGGFNINGTITGSNVVENSGTLVGANVIRGALQWFAGIWNSAASVTVASNSTLFVVSGNDHDFANTIVTNLGTTVWAQGRLRGGGGSLNPGTSIYNYGLWDVQSDGYALNNDGGGNGTVIYNSGDFRKSVGDSSTATVIDGGVSLLNSGSVSALSGRLIFNTPPTLDNGVLNFGIADTNAFGVISVNGTANLGGGVGAILLNGFLPAVGSTFNVMTYFATNGIFTDYARLNAGSGVAFTPNIGPNTFILSTIATNFVPVVPTIINQPSGQTINYGDNLILRIGVSGSPVLRYQWSKDNVLLNGATNALLAFSNVTFTAAGTYTVTVTNGSGGVLSQPAQVTVVPIAPGITADPQSITVAAGSNAVFTVGIKGAPTPTIRWYFNGTNLLVDGGRIGGASSTILTVSNIGPSDFGNYSATVSNAFGFASSGAAILHVGFSDIAPMNIIAPATATLGQALQIVYTITNQASGKADGPWQNQFFLANDTNGSNAVNLGTAPFNGTIPAFSSVTVTQTVITPGNIFGTRFFGVLVDSSVNISEVTRTNNTAWSATGTIISAPDLTVSNLSVPASVQLGSAITVNWTRWNIGSLTNFTAGQDQIFLTTASNSFSGARLLASVAGSVEAPGTSVARSQSVAIPLQNGLPAGNYWLVVAVDSPDSQAESDEGNNLASRPLLLVQPPLPDLAIADFAVPTQLIPGADLQASWTVTNSGTLGITNGVWRERVRFTNATTGLLTLGEWEFTNTLFVGSSVTRTQAFTVPLNLAANPGLLTVVVDVFDTVVELSETNNYFQSTNIPVAPRLFLNFSADTILEGGTNIIGIVSRNGDTNSAISVTLSNDFPARLVMTNKITIPAGAVSAAFSVALPNNGIIDGTVVAHISTDATNYLDATELLTLDDESSVFLTLTLDKSQLLEGTTVAATVTRSDVSTNSLTVFVGVADPLSLAVPTSVTINANTNSCTFTVLATDNSYFDGTRTNSVRVGAVGYTQANQSLIILDDDLPTMSLQLTPAMVAENGGPQAARLAVHLTSAATHDVVVDLESSDTNFARVASQVTVPAGQTSAGVPVSVIDNSIIGANPPVSFVAYLHQTGSTTRLAATTPVTLTIVDDDSLNLSLSLDRDLVSEGLSPAAHGTITRSGSTASALVVTLGSSAITEATVPPTVTIPSGAASAAFNINSIADGVTDGSKRVTLTASANGFPNAQAVLTVSDSDLPDLHVAHITPPTAGFAEASFSMNYRIENQGRVAAPSNLVTRVYLRTDPLATGGTLIASYTLPSSLGAGQFFEQSLQGRFPTAVGTYYLVVITDPDGQIAETLEDNNTLISDPITTSAPFTATVQASVHSAVAGTPIPMAGHAQRTIDSSPAGNVAVTIQVWHNGFLRTLAALTDGNGNFSSAFQPFPGEAGTYSIGANHPGVTNFVEQDSFTLQGLSLAADNSNFTIHQGQQATGTITISNLSSIDLPGLAATVLSQPPGWNIAFAITNSTLPGSTGLPMGFTVTPTSTGIGTIVVRVSAGGGVSNNIVLTVGNAPLVAQLVATPAPVFAGMIPGQQTVVSFKVANLGGAATGPINVNLPAVPWLSLASSAPLAPLNPGETNTISLLLSPPLGLDLLAYPGSLLVDAGNAVLNVPFEFRALSEAKGSLNVSVVDELTYYADGAPRVTNALVIVRDAVSHDNITNGITGADGSVFFPGMPEGYYEIEVNADKHTSFIGNTFVPAGTTNQFEPFVSRTLIQYVWSVQPTEIEDHTKIVIDTIFETVVPLPVVTIEPAYIDLADLQEPETQIELRISNHGLIAAQNVGIDLPVGGPVTFESVATDLGTLPAQSSITVPVKITFPSATGAIKPRGSATRDQCYYYIREKHQLQCGKQINTYYSTSAIRDSKATGCSPAAGGGSGGGGGGGPVFNGGPLAPYGTTSGPGGSSSFYAPRTIQQKEQCGCENFIPTCGELSGSVGLPDLSLGGYSVSLKAAGSGKLCTCCDEDGPGLKKEITASLEGALKIEIPIAGISIPANFNAGGFSCKGSLDLGGVKLDLSPKLKGEYQASEDCHGKNQKICYNGVIEGAAELKAELGPKFEISQGGTKIGEATAQATASIKGGVSAKFSHCNDGSADQNVFCILPVTVSAGVKVAFKTPGGVETELSSSVSSELTPETCNNSPNLVHANIVAPNLADQLAAAVQQSIERGMANFDYNLAGEFASKTGMVPHANPKNDSGGICAHVKVEIDQDLIIARSAFNASLTLINQDPQNSIQNIAAKVIIYDAAGHDVTDRFGLKPPSVSGMGNVDGTGLLAVNSTGTASFILVPTSDAAPDSPTTYYVGGTLSYSVGGLTLNIPLTAAPITVFPDPKLQIQYFHQRDVFSDDPFTPNIIEPTVPYNLGVMVHNIGKGIAKDVRIVSSQPQIVENDKGLLIDFKIIGTEVAGQSATPSLTATFGDVGPGQIGIARWLLTSTLQGLFIDYSATFEHSDSLGKTNISLVDDVSIHEMNHLVYADGTFADGLPDFLVNDVFDPDDYPDHVYLSDGTTNDVSVVLQGTADAPASASHTNVIVTATLPTGFTYLRIADPANGTMQLTRVTRSDGKPIIMDTNVWVTDRTFIGHSQQPIRENILHLFDYNSTGSYTLSYGPLAAEDHTTPSSSVTTLPTYVQNQFPVSWSGIDGGGGTVSFYDIYVADNFGPFTPWLQNFTELGAIYQGTNGHHYEFYSVATDNSGNREPAPIYADTSTTIALSNNPPTLSLSGPAFVDEGSNVVITAIASDPEMPLQSLLFTLASAPAGAVINPATGNIQWQTGEGNGPSTNKITVIARDNGLPPLYATNSITVVVREVNQAPVLAPVPDFVIAESTLLSYTNSAVDPDLPAQKLAFSLGAGAPNGLSVSSDGWLTWTPDSTQGGVTNKIKLIVSDNGSPSLSATQSFSIVVLDTSADFTVTIGRTNVLAGNSAQLPIWLSTGWQLTNLSFTINADPTRLVNFSVSPIEAGLTSATLAPAGTGQMQLNFAADPSQPLASSAQLARLDFATGTNTHSAFVPITFQNIQGKRLTGETVTNASGVPGQVLFVATEPLMVGTANDTGRAIQFYGRPMTAYQLLQSLTPAGPWSPFGHWVQTNSNPYSVAVPTGGNAFYRGVEFNPDPPVLDANVLSNQQFNLTLYGRSNTTYQLEHASAINGNWQSIGTWPATNSFQFRTVPATNSLEFFRLKKP